MKLNVIYEDANILVVYKKAGISSQEERGGRYDMPSLIRNYLISKGMPPSVYVVHRIDKPVAGVMVYALNQETASKLSLDIAEGRFTKKYYCITMGLPKGKHEGELVDYLVRDGKSRTSTIVPKQTKDAKVAKLRYEVIKEIEYKGTMGYLVSVELLTGRHHQIRVQLAGADAPLYGDTKYNSHALDNGQREGVALCAYELSFTHPVDNKQMIFSVTPENSIFPNVF